MASSLNEKTPEEVLEYLRWYLHNDDVSEIEIQFFHKKDYGRGDAWDRVKPGKEVPRNRWKKCHTQNYWVWYQANEPHSLLY